MLMTWGFQAHSFRSRGDKCSKIQQQKSGPDTSTACPASAIKLHQMLLFEFSLHLSMAGTAVSADTGTRRAAYSEGCRPASHPSHLRSCLPYGMQTLSFHVKGRPFFGKYETSPHFSWLSDNTIECLQCL